MARMDTWPTNQQQCLTKAYNSKSYYSFITRFLCAQASTSRQSNSNYLSTTNYKLRAVNTTTKLRDLPRRSLTIATCSWFNDRYKPWPALRREAISDTAAAGTRPSTAMHRQSTYHITGTYIRYPKPVLKNAHWMQCINRLDKATGTSISMTQLKCHYSPQSLKNPWKQQSPIVQQLRLHHLQASMSCGAWSPSRSWMMQNH